MTSPHTRAADLCEVARRARQEAGLTQEQAAARLNVARGVLAKAETDRTGTRYVKLQRRIIEELAGWDTDGPLYTVERS